MITPLSCTTYFDLLSLQQPTHVHGRIPPKVTFSTLLTSYGPVHSKYGSNTTELSTPHDARSNSPPPHLILGHLPSHVVHNISPVSLSFHHPSISPSNDSSDPIHVRAIQECLELSQSCIVSPTAFCVGSTLVLPFPPTETDQEGNTTSPSGPPIVLSTGYSREPPRPTSHAESSAVAKFLSTPLPTLHALIHQASHGHWSVQTIQSWTHESILTRADCYTTLEPCSVRTSGEPDCARLLAKAQVRRVFVVSAIIFRSDRGDR